MTPRLALAGAAWLLASAGAGRQRIAAQGVEPPPIVLPRPALAPTDPPAVYLMTFGRGDAVWERYAHNAVRVVDPAAGTDLAYNWGEFDFRQPNFLGRFLTGETKYAMRAYPAGPLAEDYVRRQDRAVYLQELAVAPAAARALADSLRALDTDERRFYRYDYYNDNCSTRVRDALDAAAGGALRRALVGRPAGTTWRLDTRRLNAGDPFIYTGIQLALGRPADRPLDRWQAGYLPLDLRAAVRDARTAGGAPLVRAEAEVWGAPDRPPDPARPPSYAWGYAAAGAAAAAALAGLGAAARPGGAGARAAFGVLAALWAATAGTLGTALLLAGTVTRHAAYMGRNWNLLGVNPLALVVAALAVAAVAGRSAEGRRRRAGRAAAAAGLVAGLAAAGAVVVLLPGLGQQSGELFLLLVPAHGALWWALRRLAGPAAPATPAAP